MGRLREETQNMNKVLRMEEDSFKSCVFESGANNSSLMSTAEYRLYCSELRLPASIRTGAKKLRGIGASQKAFGETTVHVPLNALGVILEVIFQLIDADVPKILCLRDL
jgi:hypothetical protein